MELYQLRTLVAVAQQGHLTKAAEILHLSQPAVTAQIKALEEEMGMLLFDRYSGGVSLTKAGQVLLVEAEATLRAARGMLQRAQSLQGELKGRVRIGTVSDPEQTRLAAFLWQMLEQFPLVDVETEQRISGGVLNAVRKKELDAGFFMGPNPYVNVHALHLQDLEFCVIAPASWQERVQGADWPTLGSLPWLGMSQFNSYHHLAQSLYRRHNISPRLVYLLDQEAIILRMVAAGAGLSIMRGELADAWQAEGRVVRLPHDTFSTPLQFIYPGERAQDPLLQAMVQAIRAVWNLPEGA